MTAILLAAMLALAPQQQTNQSNGTRYGTIDGVVTRFGTSDSLPDVEISLNAGGRPTDGWIPVAITDSNGRFIIEDVPPGSYTVQAERSGYANPSPNGVRIEEGGTKRTVTVRAGERTDVAKLSMVVGGVVSGSILDSTGKSLANAPVFVKSADGTDYRSATDSYDSNTDDRGDFRIAGIAPGKYYVTIGANGEFQPQTYFPGVADKNSAKAIDIAEGGIVAGINFARLPLRAPKTFAVQGKAIDRDGSSWPGPYPIVSLLPRTPLGSETAIAWSFFVMGSSSFYVSGVRPGAYDAYLYAPADIGLTKDLTKLAAIGRVEVNVTDANVDGIVIMPGGVDVNGRVTVASAALQPSGSVRFVMSPNKVGTRDAKVEPSGAFTIPNVVSGKWKLEMISLPSELALLDVRQGDTSVYENGLLVGERTPEPVQVILGEAGTVTGTVSQQGIAVGASRVVLLPDVADPSRPATFSRITATGGAGEFSFSNVAIGNYRIFALPPASFPAGSIPASPDELRNFFIPAYAVQGVSLTVSASKQVEVSAYPIH